jgi:hypothetical protein
MQDVHGDTTTLVGLPTEPLSDHRATQLSPTLCPPTVSEPVF